ncbi:molybdenum cofactor biosynthesis protein B [Cupriavidus necator]|uniref:molybdenum cofactor biosynthesis protein B n=1 Tax=Cupriavidus necator TaxID=106590 RepID=UPI0006925C4B|nr:molybdenum cofactor biosynthesis protein B [Cupriavidus necator]
MRSPTPEKGQVAPLDRLLSLSCAVLTVSDHRTPATDTSGDLLVRHLEAAGHRCVRRDISVDNVYVIRRILSDWIVAGDVQVILTNGGTGFKPGNSVPDAVVPLLDREIDGFGELFRMVSYREIGSAALQSRAVAGLANGRIIFCLPGSEDSCNLGWEHLIRPQLDSRTRPCNFATAFRQGATAC